MRKSTGGGVRFPSYHVSTREASWRHLAQPDAPTARPSRSNHRGARAGSRRVSPRRGPGADRTAPVEPRRLLRRPNAPVQQRRRSGADRQPCPPSEAGRRRRLRPSAQARRQGRLDRAGRRRCPPSEADRRRRLRPSAQARRQGRFDRAGRQHCPPSEVDCRPSEWERCLPSGPGVPVSQ